MGLSGPREDLVTMETIRYFLYLVLLLKMGMHLPVFHQGLQTHYTIQIQPSGHPSPDFHPGDKMHPYDKRVTLPNIRTLSQPPQH